MITFYELRWKNFLSTGNNFNVIDLSQNKSNLILGSNGKGKSTILDAITFVLFNKPFRKINMPQLINTTNNRDCLVEIEFTINSNEYKVVRGIKPKIFEIWENGTMLQQNAAIKDCQEHLETHILKMNYKAFTQIVVIGNATYQPFMKLSPNDRRNIVETFLDIDIFTKMNTILKTRITETKEAINDVSYKYDLSKEKIKMAQTILSNSVESVESKIQANEEEINKKEVAISFKNKQIQDLNEEITQIVFNQEATGKMRDKISKLNEYLTTFKTKQKTASKEIQFLESNDSCSTCKQVIDPDFKETNLKEKKESLDKFDGAIKAAQSELTKANETLNSYLENLEEIKSKKTSIERTQVDLGYLMKDIERIQEENKRLLKEKRENIQKNKDEYDALVTENEQLSVQRDSLLSDQHLNSIAAVLLKDDGIKTKIIKYYLPMINKCINRFLNMMDFYINYTLDENFEEKIKHPARDTFSYNSFSEGEKLRVDLAILFTWREIAKAKNSISTNILIMDEVFDSSLDVAGTDDFLNIIQSMAEDTNIFIISHKDQMQDKFSNIIKFDKVNGFSKIVN
jgi:DNA repair exonuclease SbcCD ATPase subunit